MKRYFLTKLMSSKPSTSRQVILPRARCTLIGILTLLVGLATASMSRAADSAKVFPTAQAAVTALETAVAATNRAGFAELFGPDYERLVNPDAVQGAQELAAFSTAFQAAHQLVGDSNARMVLEVGTDEWPFPIPLVKGAEGWHFDASAGLDELLNRRIGRNELEVLSVMRAYVDAQREYASRDRDGDEVLEYAQKLASSPGKTDGLYWPRDLNGEVSPLGPLVAEAQEQGYFKEPRGSTAGPQPFHGYYFKILTRQGKHAPGGAYSYIINGNMIGGFALVAWPAEYGETGIMTFIVNQQGRVYQKDLGTKTDKLAPAMKAYEPDASWHVSAD